MILNSTRVDIMIKLNNYLAQCLSYREYSVDVNSLFVTLLIFSAQLLFKSMIEVKAFFCSFIYYTSLQIFPLQREATSTQNKTAKILWNKIYFKIASVFFHGHSKGYVMMLF